MNKRYHYLHAKLTRIKQMIDDYDAQYTKTDCANNNNGTRNNGDNISNGDGLRY